MQPCHPQPHCYPLTRLDLAAPVSLIKRIPRSSQSPCPIFSSSNHYNDAVEWILIGSSIGGTVKSTKLGIPYMFYALGVGTCIGLTSQSEGFCPTSLASCECAPQVAGRCKDQVSLLLYVAVNISPCALYMAWFVSWEQIVSRSPHDPHFLFLFSPLILLLEESLEA